MSKRGREKGVASPQIHTADVADRWSEVDLSSTRISGSNGKNIWPRADAHKQGVHEA